MPTAAAGRPLVIEDEGIRIAPTRLDDALRERIARASRTPVERRGDLRAQQAANIAGQRGLRELLESCGEQEVLRLNKALLDYSQRRMRAVIAVLPDGTYTYRDALDDDGTGSGPVPIPVTITIAGDRAVVDFSAVPDARPGSLNAVRAITISAVFYVFRCLAGDDVPANAGMMRVIEVVTRPGSLCDARYPSAVSAGNVETSQRLVDTLWGALAQAAPDRVPAASCGTMNNVLFGGVDPRPGPSYGRAYVHYETLGGGAGGSAAGPGADAIHTHMTNTLNTPIEELERLFPVRISEYALRPRPAPIPGTHAGGAGVRRAYTFLGDAEVTLVGDRRVCPPYGLGGAPPGQVGRHFLISAGGARCELAGKQTIRVGAGDTLVVETPSGGSWRPATE
jgi:N-methylhydantoinase B